MVGNPAIAVITDAYVKGIRGFDARKAAEYCENSMEKFGNGEQGFVSGNLSETLEYAYFDWCTGKLWESLGDQDKAQAAVCSTYAAKIHGLEVLVDEINDEADNSTRFIVVTNQKIFLKDASKISIEFELPHESGSLYNILSHFIYNDLNMTKIESRPVEGKQWEYRFFVDFDGNLEDAAVKNAIRGLREEARNLRILGNYSIDGQI